MLPLRLQLFAALALFSFLCWVAWLIRYRRLSLRDSLSWLLSTFAALLVTLFPRALIWVARALDIAIPANALFALAFLYILWNLLMQTLSLSTNAVEIRRLSQECAMLRAELERLQRERA